jgi:hypothetical protein
MANFSLTVVVLSLIIIGSLGIDGVAIKYNGLTHYFDEADCTVENIAECFNLDPEDDMHLLCDCGSYLNPNEDGLFEDVSSDDSYICNGDDDNEEDNECSCNDIIEIDLTPLNNWSTVSGSRKSRATREGNTVHLSGYVTHSGKPLTKIFQLPEGFRPLRTVVYENSARGSNYGIMLITITSDGAVTVTSRNGNSPYSFLLDLVSFIAA